MSFCVYFTIPKFCCNFSIVGFVSLRREFVSLLNDCFCASKKLFVKAFPIKTISSSLISSFFSFPDSIASRISFNKTVFTSGKISTFANSSSSAVFDALTALEALLSVLFAFDDAVAMF